MDTDMDMDMDTITEKLNALGESVYDYETSHEDAGNSYAHLPCESWTAYDESRLAEYMQEKGIDFTGLELDEISTRVLDQFEMESGHIFSNGSGGFLVAAYPVGEIEMEVHAEDIGLPAFTKELCDSLSRSSAVFLRYDSPERAFGYMNTDSVWDCVISESALRDIVSDMQAES
jgi:hypothetical protein